MPELLESLARYIGRTVTIFTTSGGLSGSGFTGVLASVCDGVVRLITDIGAPPACPVGSACTGWNCGSNFGGWGNGSNGFGGWGNGSNGFGGNGFGLGYGWNGYGGNGFGSGFGGGCGCGCGGNGFDNGFNGMNWLGSVTEIPIDRIASFTHNAI